MDTPCNHPNNGICLPILWIANGERGLHPFPHGWATLDHISSKPDSPNLVSLIYWFWGTVSIQDLIPFHSFPPLKQSQSLEYQRSIMIYHVVSMVLPTCSLQRRLCQTQTGRGLSGMIRWAGASSVIQRLGTWLQKICWKKGVLASSEKTKWEKEVGSLSICFKDFTSLLVVELWIFLTQAFHLLLEIKSIKSVSSCWTRTLRVKGLFMDSYWGNIYIHLLVFSIIHIFFALE